MTITICSNNDLDFVVFINKGHSPGGRSICFDRNDKTPLPPRAYTRVHGNRRHVEKRTRFALFFHLRSISAHRQFRTVGRRKTIRIHEATFYCRADVYAALNVRRTSRTKRCRCYHFMLCNAYCDMDFFYKFFLTRNNITTSASYRTRN